MPSTQLWPPMTRSTASLRLVGRIHLPRDAPNLQRLLREDLLVRVIVLHQLQEALGGRAANPLSKLHNVLSIVPI